MTPITLNGYIEALSRGPQESPLCYAFSFRAIEDHAAGIRKNDALEVCGIMSPALAHSGMPLSVTGNYIKNSAGNRLDYQKAMIRLTPNNDSVTRYLSVGVVAGINRQSSGKIVKHFGRQTLQILDANPEKIKEVPGITEVTHQQVISLWKQHRKDAQAVIEAMSIGLSLVTARRAVEHFGATAADQLLANPYLLSYVHGYGFIKSDLFARLHGVAPDSDNRIQAAFWYCLNEASHEGHTYLPFYELVSRVSKETKIPVERIRGVSLPEEIVITPGRMVYTRQLYDAERYVARHIRIMSYQKSFPSLSPDTMQRMLETNGELSADQRQALFNVLTGPRLSVIMGLPGTGKTTLIKALLSILSSAGLQSILTAPTGKAAARITEQTGHSATTIHRALGLSRNGSVLHNETNPLKTDCLVIDEGSMVDVLLMEQVLRSLSNNTVLILVGDDNQLPSVGPGSVFREIKEKGLCNIVTLTEIHRQSRQSLIIKLAHSIHGGRFPDEIFREDKECLFFSEDDAQKIKGKVIDLTINNKLYPPEQIQVLSPMRKGPIGTMQLNMELKARLRPHNLALIRSMGYGKTAPNNDKLTPFYDLGDRVIQKYNNHKKHIFNGEIGYVVRRAVSEETEGERITVLFDDGRQVSYEPYETQQLELAYALTVHKGQGSEYPCVIVPVHTSHYIMLFRSLLYTAVTRAKKTLVIVGSSKASAMAVSNNRPDTRYANLSETAI